jgi:hypothetical protein
MSTAIRFLKHLYRLRSVSLALWVMNYENVTPPNQK